MRQIHDRTPVILDPGDYALWLDPSAKPERLQTLFRPAAASALVAVPVSDRVNNPKNDDPSVIEPTGETLSGLQK